MAHIRRKFVDVQQSQGSAIAEEAIKRIAKLYGIEKEVRGHSPKERVAIRQKNAKPIFDDLEQWLHAQLPKISGKSPLEHFRVILDHTRLLQRSFDIPVLRTV